MAASALTEFDSRHVHAVRAILEAGSVTRAARQLRVSQPALTATLQRVEGALGLPLVERHARGGRPTDAGRRFLGHARVIRDALSALVDDVAAATIPLAPLELGASTTIAAGIAPALFARFRAEHGAGALRLRVGNTNEVLSLVRAGEIPLGLVEGRKRAPGLHLERFVDDPLVPVAAVGLALPTTPLASDVPILLRELGSGTRDVVERALRKAGRPPREHDLELGSNAAIRAAAREGLGIGFLSRWTIADDLAAGRLRRVDTIGLDIPRRFSWASPSREISGIAGRFYRFAMDARPSLGALR